MDKKQALEAMRDHPAVTIEFVRGRPRTYHKRGLSVRDEGIAIPTYEQVVIPWDRIKSVTPAQELGIDWGHYNKMPTPYKAIPAWEFTRLMFCGSVPTCPEAGTDFRQVNDLPGTRGHVSVRFFQVHSAVLAVAHVYGHKKDAPEGWRILDCDPDGDGYCDAVQYYRVGCEHPNMRNFTEALFLHGSECPDCGFVTRYDSSG